MELIDVLAFACVCAKVVKSNQATPILQCHGQDDMLVAHSFGSMTSQLIHTFNNQLQFKSYPGLGHSSCEEVCTIASCNRLCVCMHLICMPSPTDRCVIGIMFQGFPSVDAFVRALLLLARCFINQWKEFHVVEGTYELIRF